MRKLKITQFMTLDGVVQAPGGPTEDKSGRFAHGGWSFTYWDEMMGKVMDDFMAPPFDLLLGHFTYGIFAAHWPKIPSGDPTAAKLNSAKKYVVSKKRLKLEWNNSEQIAGNVVNAIKNLKAQDGPEIQVHGSGNLAQTLIKNGLVDEFQLFIFPVTIGKGKRLFAGGTRPEGFKLLDSKVSTTGVMIARYAPAGELKTGSFALDEGKG